MIPDIRKIPMSLRWNMDETGLTEGTNKDYLVLGNSKKRTIYVQNPGDRTWTSILECISANGRHLPPLVIFKGETVQHQWFPAEIEDYASWSFTSSTNG
ncbi:transposase [Colletotrichum orchidophilum]|uniref:Transposase n=1 Tax=Colletotrichum orchidophilum TaxID=1209926 RepID=A0A1G4AT43_9PEZI|nr:transposase [Colletotrichum orchidophilum]OHE92285.1 transposase [Colletotrichum orchidophilum]